MRALALVLAATAAAAGELPAYLNDRSTPEAVVRSLYNAIERQEYLRAWSYFAEGVAPDPGTFRAGYADTASVELRLGEAAGEGASGSTWWTIPVAIEATSTAGGVRVFAGCYTLSRARPVLQETPPFAPIAIRDGTLRQVSGSLEANVPERC